MTTSTVERPTSAGARRFVRWPPSPRVIAAAVAVLVVVAIVLAVLLTRTTPGSDPPVVSAAATTPTPTVVAAANVDVIDVFDEPDATAQPRVSLDRRDELSGQLVFVVNDQREDWLEVQLPIRPNGSTGWIAASSVSLSSHEFAIEVVLGEHMVRVTRAGEQVMEAPIGVGTADAPTPGGVYYIKELLEPPDPGGVYGVYAYGLSGFSTVFTSYAGGAGVIGIHGTNRPDSIGGDVSDGCIRVTNEIITEMVEDIGIPLGTPVTIRA